MTDLRRFILTRVGEGPVKPEYIGELAAMVSGEMAEEGYFQWTGDDEGWPCVLCLSEKGEAALKEIEEGR